MEANNKVKKSDFVEIKYTGYHDGKVFDSNIPEDLKTLNPEAKPEKTVVAIGEGMVVEGLDKALEDKEIGEEYEIHVPYRSGFGERKRELVKTIPLHVFTAQKIDPKPGASLIMDNMLARIITVSGARVITDFNNPLSGKDLDYKFTIIKKVTDEKEKAEALFSYYLKTVPEFEIKEKDIVVRGPQQLEQFVMEQGEIFKKLLGKELKYEEKKEEKAETMSQTQ